MTKKRYPAAEIKHAILNGASRGADSRKDAGSKLVRDVALGEC
jgi:hypothetical protein